MYCQWMYSIWQLSDILSLLIFFLLLMPSPQPGRHLVYLLMQGQTRKCWPRHWDLSRSNARYQRYNKIIQFLEEKNTGWQRGDTATRWEFCQCSWRCPLVHRPSQRHHCCPVCCAAFPFWPVPGLQPAFIRMNNNKKKKHHCWNFLWQKPDLIFLGLNSTWVVSACT